MSTPDPPQRLHLHRWRDPAVLALAGFAVAAGFGQFSVVVALGDVAEGFGATGGGNTIAEQAGLSGTALGIGLAVIRVASLLALPRAAAADRVGRRRTLLWCCGLGMALTALAALSPTYAVFVAVFALGRPLLSATDTVSGVAAAEQTASPDRARALALVAAAYGLGAGLIAVLRGLAGDALGFRAVFALAVIPLVGVLALGRFVTEPDRFRAVVVADTAGRTVPVLGAVAPPFRRRLLVLAGVMFSISAVTGPANSFLFLYVENVLDLPSTATAAMVMAAGLCGLGGLLLGRAGADRIGRRPTVALAMVAVPAAGIVTYSGSVPAAVTGYLTAVLFGSAFLPAMGALQAELFPTPVRAAAAGWMVAASVVGAFVGLVAFGLVADAGDRFVTASAVVFAPMALAAVLVTLVPETRGRELEDAGQP